MAVDPGAWTFKPVGSLNQTVAGRTWFVESAQRWWSVQRAINNTEAFRFEARPGDYWSGDASQDRIRAELQCSTREPIGGTVWVSYAIKVSADPGILSDSLIIGQFHQSEDAGDFAGYPPFALSLLAGGLSVDTATVPEAVQPLPYPKTVRLQGYPFSLSTWHYIVLKAKFGFLDDAVLQLWIDGVAVLDLSGISMGMNDAQGPYWKRGIYWRPETAEQVITIQSTNFEIGATDLSDRIANPLPL